MRGTVHVAIGASAPTGLVLTGHVTILQGATMAAISAGFALAPDLDTPNSLASKALGGVVHRVVHSLCRVVFTASAAGPDRSRAAWRAGHLGRDPFHRTLTHTLVAAVAVGAVAYLVALTSLIAAGLLAALGVFLLWPLDRRLGRSLPGGLTARELRRLASRAAVVAVAATGAALGAMLLLGPWLMALAVGGGYLSHLVADACTKQGVPALWPLPVDGRRWWEIKLLGPLVRSGDPVERGPAVGVSLASNGLLLLLVG